MTSSPLQISVLPQPKKGKKTSKSKSILPMIQQQNKSKGKIKESNFAQVLLQHPLNPSKTQEIQNKATPTNLKISKSKTSLSSQSTQISPTQKQLLTQSKLQLQTPSPKPETQHNLKEALTLKPKSSSRTLRDIQKITQDHQLNLTKLETSSTQNNQTKPKKVRGKTPQIKPQENPQNMIQTSPHITQKVQKNTQTSQISTLTESSNKSKQRIAATHFKPSIQTHTNEHSNSQIQNTQSNLPTQPIQTSQPTQFPLSKEGTLAALLAQKSQNDEIKAEEKIEDKKNEKTQDLVLSEAKRDTQHKIAQSRETLNHFTQRLREEIANYKPPFTKLSMELNPQELGKLEVTITKKGKELQVNINANNTNALQTFIQNQNEFRTTLANAGFSNVELNFSQGDSQKQKNQQEEQNQKGNKNSLENLNETPLAQSMEIKMVQYA
ncbi:flagellar hook-length control protein FliK [Helicobacter pametensis]|uniref:flagellar hook-length control protein FliK n=1 Tax=Helicobacter pametensis TaxID=95149 RepID=UPI000483E6FD|nr:flagellar hook-length control protein FliK [Helicobacter pametensis]